MKLLTFILVLLIVISDNVYSQSKTALLVIDIQNDYFEGGACGLTNSMKASENAKSVLNYFRKQGNPVVHIQHISVRSDATFFLPNTFGTEIHSSVSPIEKEIIIHKNYPNSFRDTDLLNVLKEMNVSELVIVGMMTHMCIDATARAAKDYGFNCTIIGDACATKDLIINNEKVNAKDVHTAFLSALSYYYADIVDSQDFMD